MRELYHLIANIGLIGVAIMIVLMPVILLYLLYKGITSHSPALRTITIISFFLLFILGAIIMCSG